MFQMKPQTYISKENIVDELKQEVVETEDQLVEYGRLDDTKSTFGDSEQTKSSDQFIRKSFDGPRLCLVIKRTSHNNQYFSYFKRLRKYSHYLQFKQ